MAVFGLLHLSKDKTYVRGDEYIGRIGNSYLETLKTPDTANVITTKHKECLLRIAPHPFGIAQTYWLAKVMYKHQLIMPYLALRFNLPTPPPIQRIIVILEAAREWENLPAARDVLEMFSANLSRLKTQEIAIKEAPPRYTDYFFWLTCYYSFFWLRYLNSFFLAKMLILLYDYLHVIYFHISYISL